MKNGKTQKNTDTKNGASFSLKTVEGQNVVWIEESGLTNKQLNNHQAVAEYIAQHIGEVYTIIESGQKVYIGEDLPQEYTQSKYTTYLRGVNQTAARGKNKAVDGFGELIETATNRRWEKTRHTHNKDARYGMYRYDNSFAFPIKDNKGNVVNVRAFDIELLIRNASDGNKYLYDIVEIEENTTAEIGLLERMTRLPDESQAARDSVSNDKIPQNPNSVNTQSMQKTEKNSAKVEEGLPASQERFSLKKSEEDLSSKDREELIDIIEHLKGELEVTKFPKVNQNKLKKMTKKLLKEYSSDADFDETFKAIDELYRYMAGGEDGYSPAAWEEVYDRAYRIAQDIVENAVVVDDAAYNEYASLREYLRTTSMRFDCELDSVPGDYEGFNDFRKLCYPSKISQIIKIRILQYNEKTTQPYWLGGFSLVHHHGLEPWTP